MSRVSDYDGANNHMGSRFTASREALLPVMQELSARKLFFLDSRTTADTQAEKLARETGILTGARDIFLDNDETAPAVEHELASLEDQARSRGSAIAIGHPHEETLAALKVWSKDVEARGFRLVTLKTVLELRAGEQKRVTASKLAHTPSKDGATKEIGINFQFAGYRRNKFSCFFSPPYRARCLKR